MKVSKTLLGIFLLFLIVNTFYFWRLWVSIFLLPICLGLCVIVLVLLFLVTRKTIRFFKQDNKLRANAIELAISFLLLGLIIIFPSGMIDFSRFESPVVLKAYRKAGGGSPSVLSLKEDGTFTDTFFLFGYSESNGTYQRRNDTIFFDSDNFRIDYAIVDSLALKCHLKNTIDDCFKLDYTIVD